MTHGGVLLWQKCVRALNMLMEDKEVSSFGDSRALLDQSQGSLPSDSEKD